MARLDQTFRTEDVPPDQYEPLPIGDYRAEIIASDIKPTKDGSGQYIQFEMKILEGDYAGRMAWDRINLWNQNETAARIAVQTMKKILDACGKGAVDDTEELHQIPFILKITMRQNKKTGEMQNAYSYAREGEAPAARPKPTQPAQPAQRPAVTAPSGGVAKPGGKPWERKRT
jgi:hypothetical protein